MNGNIVLIVLSIATVAECGCGDWSVCTRRCSGGQREQTCDSGLFGWGSEKHEEKCNQFCFNAGTYSNMRCYCSAWRSGSCCEDCRHISIPHCMPGYQQCGGSPDGIRCTSCYLPYQSAGYNNGCVRTPCSDRNGLCEHTCLTERGVPKCLCRSGYLLDTNGYSCIDINECRDGSARCTHICTNTVGSFSCSCLAGYRLGSDGRTCSDIDECLTGTAHCAHVCTNTNGSFSCSCDPGFQLQSDRRTCSDVDECSVSNGRCSHICHNLPGSYICECSTGFKLDTNKKDCTDINECQTGTSRCSQKCINTAGSYMCGCSEGFALDKDNVSCTDVDDCVGVVCQNGGRCDDNMNSYSCSCAAGYNGQHCEKDIDECDGYLNGGCEDVCVNTEGSFHCACSGNATLQSNGYICSGSDNLSPSIFSRYGLVRRLLPRGCSTILMNKCGTGNTLNIILSSTSTWYKLKTNSNIKYTFGIAFVEINALAMPLSVSGLQIDISTYKIITGSLQFSENNGIEEGETRRHECLSFDITPRDIYDILQENSFTKTFLNNIKDMLPPWLSFSQSGSVLLGLNDLHVDIEDGNAIEKGECKGAPLDAAKLYTVFKIGKGFQISLYGKNISMPEHLQGRKYCIIVDICQDFGNTVFLILPEESRDILDDVTMFQSLAHYGIKIRPIGLGFSLTKHINVDTTDITVWRGEDTFFKYMVNTSANIWMKGAASMELGPLRIEGQAEAFISIPSLNNLLKSLFMGEWQFGAHITAKGALHFEFEMFGKSVRINLLRTNALLDLYGSLGGLENRTWCGAHANPSGVFLNVLVDINIFKDIPVLSLVNADVNAKVHAYLLSDPTSSTKNSINLLEDVLNVKNFTESFINLTVKSAFQYASILTNQSVVCLQDINEMAEQMVGKLEHIAQVLANFPKSDLQTILTVLEGFDDIWNDGIESLKIQTTNFVESLKNNTHLAANKYEKLFSNEINYIERHITNTTDKLMNQVTDVFKKQEGFGLKFNGEIKFFGIQLLGLEIEFIYSSGNKKLSCNSYNTGLDIMKNEKAIRLIGVVKTGVIKICPFIRMGIGAGFGMAISLETNGKFEIIYRIEATILGMTGHADIYITSTGLYFFIEGNIWSIFKAQLDVSCEKQLLLEDHSQSQLEDITLRVKGQLIADADGDGDFSDSYLSALMKFTNHLADEANARISSVQDAFTKAQGILSDAQNWLEEKKTVIRSANAAFDAAVRAMDIAKNKLEEAKIPFQNAIDSLNEAQRKVDRLCQIKTCDRICIPGLDCSICWKKIWFVNIPYPCCHFTSCMFSIPNPICEAINLGCYAIRGIAYAALELAKLVVRLPMLVLDAAKLAVSGAQFVVDKSRVVLKIAEGALSLAQIGLEGANVVLEGAKLALEAVKQVVKLGVMVLNFVIKYAIQTLIDVRNCGFELDLSTRDLPIFDVHCEINAFRLGFKQVRIRINFNDPVQSIWNAAKATIETLLETISDVISGRRKREIRDKTLSGMYLAMRSIRDADIDTEHFDVFVNQTIDTVYKTPGFKNITTHKAEAYEYRKQIFSEKCSKFKTVHSFLYDTIESLLEMVHTTADTFSNISNTQSSVLSFNMDSITANFSIDSIGIDPDVAENEFNLSISTLSETVEYVRGNLSTNPLLNNVESLANEATTFMDTQIHSSNKILIVNQWVAAMNNVSSEYFDNDTCVSYLDCAHYSVSALYESFTAVNVTNQTDSLQSISKFEDEFLRLVGNGSHTIMDVDTMAAILISWLEKIQSYNVFCSKAPERIESLRNQSVSIGSVVSIVCNATGDPSPTFWWYKDDELLENFNEMILTIANATPEDAAKYYCVAGNLVANYTFDSAEIVVFEEEIRQETSYNNTDSYFATQTHQIDSGGLSGTQPVSFKATTEEANQQVKIKVVEDNGHGGSLAAIIAPVLLVVVCAMISAGVLIWRFHKRKMARKDSTATSWASLNMVRPQAGKKAFVPLPPKKKFAKNVEM
ncbi:uncharacterized protein LOC127872819 [Dreissena polymorpha]|uniref:Uncharacterized protein n=1 Tax=Dreissena polymorpha TaxID=45954 RepID=A0A9D4QVU8_DREPO|nr:uncharacterized protein LOC127872819 [Dreissena polymorpha]KAH3844592.1 hypothetical protein DPMN_086851 [Dreissena polymorpha]